MGPILDSIKRLAGRGREGEPLPLSNDEGGRGARGRRAAAPKNDGFAPWLRRKLSSLTTSIYILGLMALFYTLGTIFPQDATLEEYIGAGGKYVWAVKAFGLLEIFSSPAFVLLSLALLLNLAVCTYDRYVSIFGKRAYPKDFDSHKTIYLTQNAGEAHAEVRRVLREHLGFRLVSKDSDWVVMEKGLPWRLLTVLYHAGLLVCVIGFFITFFFAYEGEVTLYPGKPSTIKPGETGRLQGLLSFTPKETGWSLLLDEFSAQYYQRAKLDYPKERASRLAVGLGWQAPAYELKEDSLFPKEWTSSLRVIKDNLTVHAKTIEVNDPLKYGGYTFYQMGYEQKVKIKVDSSPILFETKTGEDLFIPGLSNPVKFSELKTGTMQKIEGGIEKIVPFTKVSVLKGGGGADSGIGSAGGGEKKSEAKKEYDEAGTLRLGSTIEVEGRRLTLSDVEEASLLSFRYDPGVPLLWLAGIFVLATLSLRCYSSFYTLAYNIDETGGITFVDLNVSARGVFADRDKLLRRLEYFLTREDIRPRPIPPSKAS